MLRMIQQDIEGGHGLCLLDPHGDLAEAVADATPAWRVNDIVYLNPADLAFPTPTLVLPGSRLSMEPPLPPSPVFGRMGRGVAPASVKLVGVPANSRGTGHNDGGTAPTGAPKDGSMAGGLAARRLSLWAGDPFLMAGGSSPSGHIRE